MGFFLEFVDTLNEPQPVDDEAINSFFKAVKWLIDLNESDDEGEEYI